MKLLSFARAIPLLVVIAWTAIEAQTPDAGASPICTLEVEITGAIGPATTDLLARVQDYATDQGCNSILLLVNTRMIVERILNSPIPYLCLVSPSGGHAGSAGAIILQACHVNGAVKGTNLGAATPVSMGQDLPDDIKNKIMNDTRSWLESLTKLRGRNEKFGRDIILEAKAVTGEEAQRLGAIDTVSSSRDEFLEFASNRTVKMSQDVSARVTIGPVKRFEHDSRHKVLSLVTDPELAYFLLLGALALLYFEITHPGTMVAGVVGGIALVIALIALHKLDVEWGGLALIILGVGLLIAEMFLPTFGMLGIGGVVAVVLGSLFLFDPVKSWGYQLPWTTIAPVVIFFAFVFLGVSYLMLQTRKVKKRGGFDELMGKQALVVKNESPYQGMVELQGELWKFTSKQQLTVNDRVRVQGYEGLVLLVEKEV
jgi:membrane-bound serine protease (ClpP class)